jgi:hypothetical protein
MLAVIAELPTPVSGGSAPSSKRTRQPIGADWMGTPIRIYREPRRRRHERAAECPRQNRGRKNAWQCLIEAHERLTISFRLLRVPIGHLRSPVPTAWCHQSRKAFVTKKGTPQTRRLQCFSLPIPRAITARDTCTPALLAELIKLIVEVLDDVLHFTRGEFFFRHMTAVAYVLPCFHRCRVRCLLQPHVAADSWGLLERATCAPKSASYVPLRHQAVICGWRVQCRLLDPNRTFLATNPERFSLGSTVRPELGAIFPC